ncbi:unnamed protein product [Medioppia subpectinata]|uniref:EGF-like domain-containing protein n=1 Tax=Medioppia subpectinata TaxID=1979941 RepID=A0A7R9KVV5_9ACAR|nr:unnamed protein product [Medioppia subpectinata]CAG2110430.1 unnamed protein product [Medioppia subpectinata]
METSGGVVFSQHYNTVCDTSSTVCPLYSTCLNDPAGNSLYSCKCTPLNSFTATSKTQVDIYKAVGPDDKHVIEICSVNKVCEGKCTTNGKCHVAVEPTGVNAYEALPICVCNKGFTYDGTVCNDNCGHIDCNNNGKASLINDRCVCDCNEKYYGVDCKNEYSVSNGGWIAGIVVLAVAVVVVGIVAGIFFRKSRKHSGGHGGQHMDDFGSATAYRPPNSASLVTICPWYNINTANIVHFVAMSRMPRSIKPKHRYGSRLCWFGFGLASLVCLWDTAIGLALAALCWLGTGIYWLRREYPAFTVGLAFARKHTDSRRHSLLLTVGLSSRPSSFGTRRWTLITSVTLWTLGKHKSPSDRHIIRSLPCCPPDTSRPRLYTRRLCRHSRTLAVHPPSVPSLSDSRRSPAVCAVTLGLSPYTSRLCRYSRTFAVHPHYRPTLADRYQYIVAVIALLTWVAFAAALVVFCWSEDWVGPLLFVTSAVLAVWLVGYLCPEAFDITDLYPDVALQHVAVYTIELPSGLLITGTFRDPIFGAIPFQSVSSVPRQTHHSTAIRPPALPSLTETPGTVVDCEYGYHSTADLFV